MYVFVWKENILDPQKHECYTQMIFFQKNEIFMGQYFEKE